MKKQKILSLILAAGLLFQSLPVMAMEEELMLPEQDIATEVFEEFEEAEEIFEAASEESDDLWIEFDTDEDTVLDDLSEESFEETTVPGEELSGNEDSDNQSFIEEFSIEGLEEVSEESLDALDFQEVNEDGSILLVPELVEHHSLADEPFQDNEELFSDYVERQMYGNNGIALLGTVSRDYLSNPMECLLYDALKEEIKKVAAGERASTAFYIPVTELGIPDKLWTAEDLGVDHLFDLGADNILVLTSAAQKAMHAMLDYRVGVVVRALMQDTPYELYWFDKTKGYVSSNPGISGASDGLGNEYIRFASKGSDLPLIGVKLAAATGYLDENAESYTSETTGKVSYFGVDTEMLSAVPEAISYAQSLVVKHAGKNDYDKLAAYCDEICELNTYNSAAAAGGAYYGDPWQLIYVFDRDPSTNVVCEGYSKAFQYLFDLSTFEDDISCYTVWGKTSGNHMWNIVNMPDGKNYIMDITNCDSGYKSYLFMGYASSGNPESGYSISTYPGNSIKYTYKLEDLNNILDPSMLVLATEPYSFCRHQLETVNFDWDGYTFCTASGVCTECGKIITKTCAITEKECNDASCTQTGSVKYEARLEYGSSIFTDTQTETLSMLEHTSEDIAEIPATCTTAGQEAGKKCSVCGTILEGCEVIPVQEHIEEVIPGTAATCTETGLKAGKKCSVCGKILLAQEVEAMKAHTIEDIAGIPATCITAGKEAGKKCKVCGTVTVGQKTIAALGHKWSDWTTVSEATVFQAEQQKRTCSRCSAIETRTQGVAIRPSVKLSATKLILKTGQKTNAFTVSQMAKGDYVKSWKLSKTGIVKVSGKKNGSCTITALKKVGKTKLTIVLASGLSKTVTIDVQKEKVTTKSIKLNPKTLNVKKGKKVTILPIITPITSTEKLTFSSSNKKIATVTSKGVVKGIKAGTAKITVTSGSKKAVCTIKVTK